MSWIAAAICEVHAEYIKLKIYVFIISVHTAKKPFCEATKEKIQGVVKRRLEYRHNKSGRNTRKCSCNVRARCRKLARNRSDHNQHCTTPPGSRLCCRRALRHSYTDLWLETRTPVAGAHAYQTRTPPSRAKTKSSIWKNI
ncbi:hypothetical protein EVAR_58967_1 [Eumeta japonica]|uniref:Uncharacterized protein n=1 Tax=Eumeta variegata TaxID=151549 RepID=A0A4C1YEC4_EUMVA|nr:hypothetical protein EVAR_58967_1 [Eumeta japonica]